MESSFLPMGHMYGDLNLNLAESVDLSVKRMIASLADDLGYFYGWRCMSLRRIFR